MPRIIVCDVNETLLDVVRGKYRRLCSSTACSKKPGPIGPNEAVIRAIARKMIRELRSLGYRVELLPAPSSSPA
jgi:hypothetical protein